MQVLDQRYNASYKALRAAKEASKPKLASNSDAQGMDFQDSFPASGLLSSPSSSDYLIQQHAEPPPVLAEPLLVPPSYTPNPYITQLLETPRSQAEAANNKDNEGVTPPYPSTVPLLYDSVVESGPVHYAL